MVSQTKGDSMKVLGELFGAEITSQLERDDKSIQLLSEDDENWFPFGTAFSSYWLDDLIQLCYRLKDACKPAPEVTNSRVDALEAWIKSCGERSHLPASKEQPEDCPRLHGEEGTVECTCGADAWNYRKYKVLVGAKN
jgi:hypothetical protein